MALSEKERNFLGPINLQNSGPELKIHPSVWYHPGEGLGRDAWHQRQ